MLFTNTRGGIGCWSTMPAPSPVNPVMSVNPTNIFVGWSTGRVTLGPDRLLQVSSDTGCSDAQPECGMYAGTGTVPQ